MTTRLTTFPICSLASRGVHASYEKVLGSHGAQLTTFNASSQRCTYSSIAHAMLGRAAKEYEAPKPKNDLAKQLFPSSSPAQDGNIQEQFKRVRQSTQSIGGFTGLTNASKTLNSRSPNINHSLQKKAGSFTASSTSNLSSNFSKQGSFQNASDFIDLTQESASNSKSMAVCRHAVQFDENDFDDDADLDLDVEYELPRPSAAVSKPPTPASETDCSMPQLPRLTPRSQTLQHPPSSAPTWSSSSPSHLAPPPLSLTRQRTEPSRGCLVAQLPASTVFTIEDFLR